MRIAIPISENKGEESLISPHFGHVRFIALYDSATNKLEVVNVENVEGCSPIAAISDKNINTIYCFGMGMRAMQLCAEKEIKIKTGRFKTVKEVINNLDKLEDLEESCGH